MRGAAAGIRQRAVGGTQAGELPGRVVGLAAQHHLPQDGEGRLDHLRARLGIHLQDPVRVVGAYFFASSQVSPVPTSTARGGSSG